VTISVPNSRPEPPRVSVVVPCYNYAGYLSACVRSALAQEGVDVDVTIVDDASTDGSDDVARALAHSDARVRLFVHPSNKGHIATFNEALGHATAPYVVKLDADDVLTPGSLRRSVDVFHAHPDVVLVYGRVGWLQGDDPPPNPVERKGSVKVWSGQEWIRRRVAGGANVIVQPEVMIRTAALHLVGGHRSDVPDASDFNLWLRLATRGDVARLRGPVQGWYRLHDASMQHTIHAGTLKNVAARLTAIELFLEECGHLLDDLPQLRRRLHRTFAREIVLRSLDSFDEGRAPSEPIEEYMQVAATLDPRVTRTLMWRELRHRVKVGTSTPTPTLHPARLVRRRRWDHRLQWLRRYRT
jgi:hypothetical protein